ncbi:MAG: transposase [Gemmatimonadetes bacterium]|nr:transposase [Gemmatimonadota bacterium]MYE93799.1 transposase [Gemmatimonadota bacterium]MYJ11683.1 transposase [Gemmatimonadota bacterium]
MAGRRRGRYPPEYKERIVELVREARTAGSLSREFEPTEQTIRTGRQADLDEGRRSDGLTTEVRKEMRELTREVKRLRMERDIRPNAAAWFARESESIPDGGMRS